MQRNVRMGYSPGVRCRLDVSDTLLKPESQCHGLFHMNDAANSHPQLLGPKENAGSAWYYVQRLGHSTSTSTAEPSQAHTRSVRSDPVCSGSELWARPSP